MPINSRKGWVQVQENGCAELALLIVSRRPYTDSSETSRYVYMSFDKVFSQHNIELTRRVLSIVQLSRLMGGDVRLVDAGFGIEHKPSLANAVADVKAKGGKVRSSSIFSIPTSLTYPLTHLSLPPHLTSLAPALRHPRRRLPPPPRRVRSPPFLPRDRRPRSRARRLLRHHCRLFRHRFLPRRSRRRCCARKV